MSDNANRTLRVTDIGEYVRHHSCARRLKLGQDEQALRRTLPFYSRLFNPLDPVLRAAGAQREDEVDQDLVQAGLADLTDFRSRRDAGTTKPQTPWSEFLNALKDVSPEQPIFAREVEISGVLGAFQVIGRIDFLILEWIDGKPRLRFVECKASRRDKTYQRIQAATYLLLAFEWLTNAKIVVGGHELNEYSLEAVVARIDEGTEEIQPVRSLPALELEVEFSDVRRLLATGGQIAGILDAKLERLSYAIESKCDHCKFNVVCLPEAGRTRALELIGVEPSTARVLRANGIDDLYALEQLSLDSQQALDIRNTLGFSANLSLLQALARTRVTTLPGGPANPDDYPVTRLPWKVRSQAPAYEIDGDQLVRVYLGVHYDYVENRIGSLAAHVTISDWQLLTPFTEIEGRWRPEAGLAERRKTDQVDGTGRPVYEQRPLQDYRDVIRTRGAPWSSNHEVATGQEGELLQSFFDALINAVAEISPGKSASIHIYVWSRSEMSQLVEACLRADTRMLRSLQELMGCREPIDQLIFSSVGEDVDRSMALGWTGRGLSVVTSLTWFGQRFHWTRVVNREPVPLDWLFRQDIFDFKTKLDLDASGGWAKDKKTTASTHSFEIRSRFFDSLSAPYWRAAWRTLTPADTPGLDAQQRNQLQRYYETAQPNYLENLLSARVHAMRWIEWFIPENPEINKPKLDIGKLRQFTLGITTPAEAALDFLRLDYHIKLAEWLATHLVPAADRVSKGTTLPLRNVHANHDGTKLNAVIDTNTYSTDLDNLRNVYNGSDFVRLSPHSGDAEQGQTIAQLLRGGSTCRVEEIDWENGTVRLSPIPGQASRYVVGSRPARDLYFDFATLDDSVTDFVAPRVDARLTQIPAHHTYQWFDTTNPRVVPFASLDPVETQNLATILGAFRTADGNELASDQKRAISAGRGARVQLLQGPPGTGKTQTTAISILSRCWTQLKTEDIVIVAAQTHTAVDELMERIKSLQPVLAKSFGEVGKRVSKISQFRVDPQEESSPGITPLNSGSAVRLLGAARKQGVVILGGTTTAILKLAKNLDESAAFGRTVGAFQCRLLVVDEASMMVLAHFLSLTTVVSPLGQIMLSGDHRQLAPIVSHNWEEEDRYPVTVYQPYVSAYEAVRSIKEGRPTSDSQVTMSSLNFTFRLPDIVRHLISPVYAKDKISLQGGGGRLVQSDQKNDHSPWNAIWSGDARLHLVVHNEDSSAKANPLEVEIIEQILDSRQEFADDSVVVMTPHRAQRGLLRTRLANRPEIRRIDTVEKMQGGECPIVIVSATASDTSSITRHASFILDLNRANVAFSRTQERLIVVCAKSLLDNVPADLENYQSAMLWKSLRELCSEVLSTFEIEGHKLTIYAPRQVTSLASVGH